MQEVNVLDLSDYRKYLSSLPDDGIKETVMQGAWYHREASTICPYVYMIPYILPFSEFDDETENEGMPRQSPYSIALFLSRFEAQSPKSFTDLEQYRIPRFFIRRIFRSVIGYVLRNITIGAKMPLPIEQYAERLLNRMVSSHPMYQNVFTYFGVPVELSRSILLNLIIFVLNNVT